MIMMRRITTSNNILNTLYIIINSQNNPLYYFPHFTYDKKGFLGVK